MTQPFRLEPAMPPGAYQTYRIVSPAATHWRAASCEEVDCLDWRNGWRVRVEELSPQLLHTATNSGRRYQVLDVAEGEHWLVFEAGQACFRAGEHKVPTGRPELYVVQGGDWRGNPTGMRRQHSKAEDWVDDFGTHQQKIADQIEKG